MTDVFVKQRNRDTDTLGEVMGGWGRGGVHYVICRKMDGTGDQ